MEAKAKAQIAIWFMKWNIDELKRQRDAVGVSGADGFASTTLG
jgi:hypothetical protein